MWVVFEDDWVTTDYIRLKLGSLYQYRYYNTFDGQEDLNYGLSF